MSKAYWTMRDGSRISVDAMTDMHVFNTLNMLYRNNGISRMRMPESVKGARQQLKNIIRYGTLTNPNPKPAPVTINVYVGCK